MGDKDPKSLGKLKDQADEKREEALVYKHETPAEKAEDKAREEITEEPESSDA
jgi:hypothetical protein